MGPLFFSIFSSSLLFLSFTLFFPFFLFSSQTSHRVFCTSANKTKCSSLSLSLLAFSFIYFSSFCVFLYSSLSSSESIFLYVWSNMFTELCVFPPTVSAGRAEVWAVVIRSSRQEFLIDRCSGGTCAMPDSNLRGWSLNFVLIAQRMARHFTCNFCCWTTNDKC